MTPRYRSWSPPLIWKDPAQVTGELSTGTLASHVVLVRGRDWSDVATSQGRPQPSSWRRASPSLEPCAAHQHLTAPQSCLHVRVQNWRK